MMQFAIKNTPIVIIVILAIMLTLEVVHQVVLTILIVMAHKFVMDITCVLMKGRQKF